MLITIFPYPGGIFSPEEVEEAATFRYAIDRLNEDDTLLAKTKLHAHPVQIGSTDSFHAHKKGKSLNLLLLLSMIIISPPP